jgi:hypothetical protein
MGNPVDDFLAAKDEIEGVEKDAGFFGSMRGEIARGGGLGGTVGRYLPAAAVSLGVAAAAGGIGRAFNAIRNRLTKQRDYKNMLSANPHLAKEDASKVQMLYNSLRSMSPSMSRDPLIAGSFVRSSLELSPESGPAVPPATAQMLAKTQESLSKAKSKGLAQHLPGMPPISLAPPERAPSPVLAGETHITRDLPSGAQMRTVSKRYE